MRQALTVATGGLNPFGEVMGGKIIHDHGRTFDWGHTSADYARHRPGYPESFYQRLVALGVGIAGQRILDLGTGTGNLARAFARLGCQVTGVDISPQQVEQAQRLAAEERLPANWLVRPAEDTGLPAGSFDVVTAAQCWLYFDRDRAVAEVKRLLAPDGRLMLSSMCWLPREDAVAGRTEELILMHNPDWTFANRTDDIPPTPHWMGDDFRVVGFFLYREPIPYTRDGWRGRIRASRGVGATMTPEQVAAFDTEHARMLESMVPEHFTVLHWIHAHILAPR